jgi:Na+/H+ antiporter NhaD/arsenite permease-like protein
MVRWRRQILFAVLMLCPAHAVAAPALDGAALSWPWALPFVGILLTIAIGPLLVPRIWRGHYGKFALAWSALTLVPVAIVYGFPTALGALSHAVVGEYASFIILLFTLYVVAGGILITGNLRGTPLTNTSLLALGTLAASVVGTTGAAMIFIRPLLRANAIRVHNVHVAVFAIFLMANIGGGLSPVGNPPLFVGFLHGVDFFWATRQLWGPTTFVAGATLVIFTALDVWLFRKEPHLARPREPINIRVRGSINFILLSLIIAVIMASAAWRPDVSYDVLGTRLDLQNLVRDACLLLIAVASVWLTPDEHREANDFSWEPIREVGLIFAGIFVALVPVLAMLQAGRVGAFGWLTAAVTDTDGSPDPVAYFWLSGILSAFLDNAPTYLVFFELAGGDASALMGKLATTLAAISMGATYMGALTYLGNAPNFMIYAIATEHGVKMPSFFGFLAWAALVLMPIFVLLTLFLRAYP